jgi:hypothetical protein
MAQQPSEIKAHIQAEGESLRENLEEIQSRVKNALDWRVWYKNNTAIALGGAAAGGLLLSLMLTRSGGKPDFPEHDYDLDPRSDQPIGLAPRRSSSNYGSRVHQVLDNTLSAIFGVATDTFQDFMSKALPGFRDHYSKAGSKRYE